MNETMTVWKRRRILATTAFFALVSVACSGIETATIPSFGTIRITVASNGGDLDTNGYHVVVDAQQVAKMAIGQTLESVNVATGTHAVTLKDVADNCVVQGSNPRTVSVGRNLITDVKFDVDCAATGIAVTIRTTGVEPPAVLQLSLVGQPTVTIPSSTSYTMGRLAAGSYTLIVISPVNCIVSGGAQVIVNVTAKAVTPVTFDITCGAVPRPERIAFVDERTTTFNSVRFLAMVNPDGTGLTTLREGDSPSWSPARTRLAFSTTSCFEDYYGYDSYCTGGILLLDPETGNVAPAGGDLAYEPSWAPTGGALVVEGFGVRSRPMRLHVLQLPSRTLSLIDINAPVSKEQPAWSPDGARIAFVCRWSDNTDLCIVNADGSNLVQLTDDAPDDLHPAWSPSGNSIAFARHPTKKADPASGEIVVIDVVTRTTTVLTKGTEPTWSPDASRLAFAGVDGLFVIGADGTNLKRLTTGNHRAPAWRP